MSLNNLSRSCWVGRYVFSYPDLACYFRGYSGNESAACKSCTARVCHLPGLRIQFSVLA